MNSKRCEPYGTTPLPVSLEGSPIKVSFDAEALLAAEDVTPQQPLQQEMARFEATPLDKAVFGACQVAVNQHFVIYTVKKGLIRVLHRHSTLKALLRAHSAQTVTDIQLFQDGDVLATAGSSSTSNGDDNDSSYISSSKIVVWRIFERSPEICSEMLLEISANNSNLSMSRVVWHPFNPNQFWMLHTNGTTNTQLATLVETTRITTTPDPVHGHAVADFCSDTVLMEGATQLIHSSELPASLTDLAWCGRDTRYILAGYDSGDIVLFDLKTTNIQQVDGAAIAVPVKVQTVKQGFPVSRCLFLPYEQTVHQYQQGDIGTKTACFITGGLSNSSFTLWSPFHEKRSPVKIQQIEMPATSSYVLRVCSGPAPVTASPPACFLTAACREKGTIAAFHCKAEWSSDKKALLVGSDYVVPFVTKYPVYSYTAMCSPATDISEEELSDQGGLIFDMKLFAYQSQSVQCLTLTSFMCLPPEHTYTDPTPGVTCEPLLETTVGSDAAAAAAAATAISDIEEDFEEYDVGDDDENEDAEFDEAPDPSSLPPPPGVQAPAPATSRTDNPFANWLGAIAAKNSEPTPPPPAPQAASSPAPVTVLSPPPGVTPPPPSTNPSFLSPMEILASSKADAAAKPAPKTNSRQPTPTAANRQNKKKSKQSSSSSSEHVTDVEILKKGVEPATGPAKAAGQQNKTATVDNAAIAEEVRRVVREEIRTTVVPSLRQALNDSLKNKSSSIGNELQPLLASLDALKTQGVTVDHDKIAQSVAAGINDPLRAAFAESMKSTFIPTLESVTGQIFQQVSSHLEKSDKDRDFKLESMSKQLSTMTALVAELTKEIQNLRTAVASNARSPGTVSAPPSRPPVPSSPPADLRSEIVRCLKERAYEDAFTKALSASTVELTIFCCRNANLQEVLGGAQPALSQPILLCLMQQLGTLLVSSPDPNLHLELAWLQEIALSLNPADPAIQHHAPGVLQQVTANINQRMQATNTNPQLRRSLQRMLQVVRGMQMG